ncbi:MAG: protein kinase [Proteobacteria bacterium]|nr:protein kinase [Pseudomonadota bacterium]
MQLSVGSDFAGYSIVRHIGGGGMAQIYLAKTRGLAGFEKYLALKVMNTEYANEDRFIRMLINEAKIAVGLSHVNIAQIFDLGVFDGIYYIAMEYVDGVDVLGLVNGLHARGQHVPIEAVAHIGRQICSGLYYAHTRKNRQGEPLNIVHRDISPQNVLVSRAGEIKVVDFGIAKAVGLSSKTQAGVIKGKVNYMAPEQVLSRPADARSDIFAVGIVLWEMLTSQMVYAADDINELAAKVRKAEIAPPSSVREDVPPVLDQVVMRALQRKANDRYQSAHELQIELTKFLSSIAPDYGGSHLAKLVEQVAPQESVRDATGELPRILSQEDRLHDRHSLIYQPDGHAQLVLLTEDGEQPHPLHDELTLGRAGDLPLADARVSRRHARVRFNGSCYLLEDLGSANGTFLNGERIRAPTPLKPSDRVRVGNSEFVFRAQNPTPEEIVSAGATPLQPTLPERISLVDGRGDVIEQALEDGLELGYRLQLGPLRWSGTHLRLLHRTDGWWIDAGTARGPVQINGVAATLPALVAIGDRVDVNGITLTISG